MRTDTVERSSIRGAQRGAGNQTLIIIIVAIVMVGGTLFLFPGGDPEPQPEQQVPTGPELPEPPRPDPARNIQEAPDIPEPEPEPVPEPEEEALPEPEPPTQEEIDSQLREALAAADADEQAPLSASLAAPFLLDRGVSAIDQVARGLVPLRALNLPRPGDKFKVRRDGQQRFVDESSYNRYDGLVDAITAVSPETLADSFQDFRPLLRDAYSALGYPADAVDNATIAALDAILAAPIIREPIALTSKGAMWAYQDPELEKRSDLHKQLMRMGPNNLEVLQRWAQALRNALLD